MSRRKSWFTSYIETNTELGKNKEKWRMFQSKEQDKTSKRELKEMEISNLPDRIQNKGHKLLTELGRVMDEAIETSTKKEMI